MSAEKLLQNFDRLIDTPDAMPRLRRFILDLAVRGKLVEQNPDDEPAVELLKRIKVEKARIVKTSNGKKDKTLSIIDEETMPFRIPDFWKWVPIRKITADRGQKIPNKKFSYIDISAIDKERGEICEPQVLTPDIAPSRARKIVQQGDVIYSCVRPYLLNIAVVNKEFEPEPIVSTAFAVLNGFGLIVPQYLWIVMRSPYFVSCVEDKMRGQAYPAINESDFANLPFPLPPLAEQHRIVAKVDNLMALCDELERTQAKRERRRDRLVAATLHGLNNGEPDSEEKDKFSFKESARFYFNHLPRLTTRPEHIQQLRETILNLAVRGKLVPQDPRDEPAVMLIKSACEFKRAILAKWKYRPSKSLIEINGVTTPHIPSNWAWARIGTFAAVKGRKRLPQGISFSKAKTPYVYIRVTDMRNQTISTEDLQYIDENTHKKLERYIIEKNDIYVVIVGSTIGKCGIIPNELHGMHLTENAAKLMFGIIDQKYILIVLQSEFVQSQFIKKTNQVGQPKLALERIESTILPIPPLAEQYRIVAKVNELMTLCDELEAQITTTSRTNRQLLETMLYKAIAA